jgi:hypothetical protein
MAINPPLAVWCCFCFSPCKGSQSPCAFQLGTVGFGGSVICDWLAHCAFVILVILVRYAYMRRAVRRVMRRRTEGKSILYLNIEPKSEATQHHVGEKTILPPCVLTESFP